MPPPPAVPPGALAVLSVTVPRVSTAFPWFWLKSPPPWAVPPDPARIELDEIAALLVLSAPLLKIPPPKPCPPAPAVFWLPVIWALATVSCPAVVLLSVKIPAPAAIAVAETALPVITVPLTLDVKVEFWFRMPPPFAVLPLTVLLLIVPLA